MQSADALRNALPAEVEAVAPILTEHAPQSEELGCLDESSVEALRKTRLLCFGCPRELGGYEADPVSLPKIASGLARMQRWATFALG